MKFEVGDRVRVEPLGDYRLTCSNWVGVTGVVVRSTLSAYGRIKPDQYVPGWGDDEANLDWTWLIAGTPRTPFEVDLLDYIRQAKAELGL